MPLEKTFTGGIFVSGNATCHYKYLWNRKRQAPPYYLLHCHAATSVFPLPVGPPIHLHPLSKVSCAFHTRYAAVKFIHSFCDGIIPIHEVHLRGIVTHSFSFVCNCLG